MDQNQPPLGPPGAPPPYQPITPHHNPYEFITNPSTPPKKKLISDNTSKKTRFMILAGGGLVLLMVFVVLYGLIFSGSGQKEDYLSLMQQQAELVRVSDIGVQKSRHADAKNLAITTKYSIVSQQSEAQKLAKQAGADTSAKAIALGKDTQTDAKLTAAEQSNQFDTVFTATIQAGLEKYQQTLKKIHDGTSSEATRKTLMQYYVAIGNLLPQKNNDAATPSSIP